MNHAIPTNEMVIDATQSILGRIASYAAKQALLGKSVIIVNCSEVLITGKRRSTINAYFIKRRRGGSSLKGPHFPKQPERIMKRTIRGMLSYAQQRGRDAFKRIRCYDALPEEYAAAPKVKVEHPTIAKTMRLQELSREI